MNSDAFLAWTVLLIAALSPVLLYWFRNVWLRLIIILYICLIFGSTTAATLTQVATSARSNGKFVPPGYGDAAANRDFTLGANAAQEIANRFTKVMALCFVVLASIAVIPQQKRKKTDGKQETPAFSAPPPSLPAEK